jgi:hypothetical protein
MKLSRIDIIGQNGNNGEHYFEEDMTKYQLLELFYLQEKLIKALEEKIEMQDKELYTCKTQLSLYKDRSVESDGLG